MTRKIPELRFPGFEGNWEEIELGNISSITTGKLDANAMVENGKYDFYTSGIAKYKIDTFAFEGPSITIAGNGATVGYMHLADGKFNAYQRTYVISDFKGDRHFIYYSIKTKLPKKIHEESRAGNIPYIVLDMLTNLKILLPTLAEQEKIGELFETLDACLEDQASYVETLKKSKKAFLQKLFPQKGAKAPELRFPGFEGDWGEERLFYNTKYTIGYTPSTKDNTNFGGNHIWYSIADFGDKYIEKSNRTLSDKAIRNDKLIKKGSLLLSFKLTLGELAITNVDCFTNEAIIAMNFNELRDTEFMFYNLKTINLLKYANRAAQGFTINSDGLNSIKIFLPSLAEQEKIGSFFKALDEKIEKEEDKLESFERLKRALLQKVFV